MNKEIDFLYYGVGVICGRFQTPKLHESHIKLFDYVTSRHKIVVCVLGVSLFPNEKNPLDFKHRAQMIREKYPNIIILKIKDCKCDIKWSKKFDEELSDVLNIGQRPLLYGSRDSFIQYYHGRFDTHELESDSFVSATEMRNQVLKEYKSSEDYRAGIIQGVSNRFPINYVCVDVAILDSNNTKILLGRKKDEVEYRFIGGFSEPTSDSLEDDAAREVLEETGCIIDHPKYIGSMRVRDWRYEGLKDSICTTFFVAHHIDGVPEAGDDIESIKWFNLEDFIYPDGTSPFDQPYKLDNLVPEHKKLMTKLLDFLKFN